MKKMYSVKQLKNLIMPIADKYKLETVYLFGSRARGDNRIDSDYDFYIKGKNVIGMFELSGLFQDLENALQADVDIVVQPINSKIKVDQYLLDDIAKDGVLVYAG